MAETTFGVILKKGGTSFGSITKLTPPSFESGKVDVTNHSSGNFSEFMPTKLISVGEMEIECFSNSATYLSCVSEMGAGTVSAWSIEFPGNAIPPLQFNGFLTSLKLSDYVAESPDVQKFMLKIQPAGSIVASGV